MEALTKSEMEIVDKLCSGEKMEEQDEEVLKERLLKEHKTKIMDAVEKKLRANKMEEGFKFLRWEMHDKERQYIDKVTKEYLTLASKIIITDRKEKQIVVKNKTKDIITAYQNYGLLDYLAKQMKKLGKDEAYNDFLYALIEAVFELKNLLSYIRK